jgi:hypothetical protein
VGVIGCKGIRTKDVAGAVRRQRWEQKLSQSFVDAWQATPWPWQAFGSRRQSDTAA